MSEPGVINTPDQRLRVFVSSTLGELAAERRAVQEAVSRLRLVPVMFELGARAHPAREVYRAYLTQSQIFIGIYWQRYGWVAPGEQVSGLEDEYLLSAGLPRLLYVKTPAPGREPGLTRMLARIRDEGGVSYHRFTDAGELGRLVEDDLAVLLSERFLGSGVPGGGADQADRADRADRAAAAVAAGLPVPPTRLVGREQEVAAVQALVASAGVRLVTLTGPGGAGKSRIAVAAAQRLGPGFADGARFLDLASVPSADAVPAALATGLGLSTSGRRLRADLVSYLSARRLLLVVDNFEQVTGAAVLLAELLAAAPGVKMLVTSRSVLRLSGEHEFPVPPLPVPAAGAGLDAGSAAQYASLQLFTERARAVAPGFRLTAGNVGAVAEICRRLDGLPLAIELAAARVRILSPRALLAELGHRLSVLTGGPRDVPERQRTLRNTLNWSFGLLSACEQALFAGLGVFAGSFGLPAAEALFQASVPGQAEAPGPVIDILNALVDSSLVQPETRGDEPRFRLLETVREYALERLRTNGAWQQAHDSHATYFAAWAMPAESELRGDGQLAWLNRLETEVGNLNGALSWLMDQGRLDEAVIFAWATWRFWWLRAHVADLGRAREQFMAKQQEMTPPARALALSGSGFALMSYGDPDEAEPVLRQSLPLFGQAGNALGGALAAAGLGHVLALRHDDERAGEALDQAMKLLQGDGTGERTEQERVQYLLDVAVIDNFRGQIQLSNGDHERAQQLFTAGLEAARSAQERFTILISLYDLALTNQARGDLQGAAGLLRQGLSLAAETGDKPSAAYYLEALAAIARRQDNPRRAARLLAAAGAQLQANGSGWLHAYVPRAPHDHTVKAELRSQLGDAAYEQAEAQGRSLTGARAIQDGLDDA